MARRRGSDEQEPHEEAVELIQDSAPEAEPKPELDPSFAPKDDHVDDDPETQAKPSEPEESKPESIPVDRFNAINERLKERTRELEQERTRWNQLDQRLASFEQSQRAAQQPKPEEPKEIVVPNKDEDYAGYIDAMLQKNAQLLEQQNKWIKQYDEREQQSRQQYETQHRITSAVQDYTAACARVAQEDPSFLPSYQRYHDTFIRQQQVAGMSADFAEQEFQRRELALYAMARKNGRNPGEVMREWMYEGGYRVDPAPPQQVEQKKPDNVPQKPKPSSPSSLSGMAGSGSRSVSMSEILKWDQDKFNEYMKANPGMYSKFKSIRAA